MIFPLVSGQWVFFFSSLFFFFFLNRTFLKSTVSVFFFKDIYFIYGLLFLAVLGVLTVVASLVAEHGL